MTTQADQTAVPAGGAPKCRGALPGRDAGKRAGQLGIHNSRDRSIYSIPWTLTFYAGGPKCCEISLRSELWRLGAQREHARRAPGPTIAEEQNVPGRAPDRLRQVAVTFITRQPVQ